MEALRQHERAQVGGWDNVLMGGNLVVLWGKCRGQRKLLTQDLKLFK